MTLKLLEKVNLLRVVYKHKFLIINNFLIQKANMWNMSASNSAFYPYQNKLIGQNQVFIEFID